jgi:hypothetical protein
MEKKKPTASSGLFILPSNDSKRTANPLTMRFSAPWERWMLSYEGRKPPSNCPVSGT